MMPHSDRKAALKSRCSTAGYTLTELLVVLVILGLLIALVAPRVMNQASNARTRAAEVQIESLMSALEYYRLDVGRYPASSTGLEALVSRPADAPNWAGPYLDRSQLPEDPWGRSYQYELRPDGMPRVYTYGADARPGGEGENRDVFSPA